MSQGRYRDRGKEQFWRRVIRQWQKSGLSVRAFCRQQRLSEPSFYGWRRTLAERETEGPRFVPVCVVEEAPRPRPPEIPWGSLELVLAGQRRLRVGPGFDAVTLQRLLAVLEEGRA